MTVPCYWGRSRAEATALPTGPATRHRAAAVASSGQDVALHYLDGFSGRFQKAVAAADILFQALRGHPGCKILRSPAATNVSRLQVSGIGVAAFPKRLLESGIAIREAVRSVDDWAEFELFSNETILRRPIADIVRAFIEALGPAPSH
jgi:hypothetical protein